MVFKKLRFWHEKFTPCLDRIKDHFLSTPSKKKKSPYFWEGFSTTVALKYKFGQIEWIMCPSTPKEKKLCASAGFSRRFTIFEGSFISIIIALDRNLQLARVSGHFKLTTFLLGSGCHKLQERSISPQICLHWNFDPMLEAKQTRTAWDFQQKTCGRLGACQVELYSVRKMAYCWRSVRGSIASSIYHTLLSWASGKGVLHIIYSIFLQDWFKQHQVLARGKESSFDSRTILIAF